MTPTGILESALYVDDLDAAEAFYADIMGLERIAKVEKRHVFFRCGEGVLLLFDASQTVKPPRPDARLPVPPHGTKGDGHLCFRGTAQEISRWKAHLEKNGVAVEADFEWPQGGRSIYFRDPAGNSLEIAEPRMRRPWKKRRRRSTAWRLKRPISSVVKASSARSRRDRSQSNQLISLSWQ
jgi:catechol 2,3-dioxygenase-like lactoylglutathione lyase family enzyme